MPQGPSADGFSIRVRPDGRRVWVAVAGDLDLLTAPRLERGVAELVCPDVGEVILDLRELAFIDVSGLNALVELARQAERDGWELSLIPARRPVRRVFEVTGMVDELPFVAARSAPYAR